MEHKIKKKNQTPYKGMYKRDNVQYIEYDCPSSAYVCVSMCTQALSGYH